MANQDDYRIEHVQPPRVAVGAALLELLEQCKKANEEGDPVIFASVASVQLALAAAALWLESSRE